MADTVADTKETTTVGTPEKKDVEKKVEVVDEDSKASTNGEVPSGEVEKPKENGTAEDKESAEDTEAKEVESAECEDSTDSVQVRATKRSTNGEVECNDRPADTPVEGASPEKKAKLEEKPAEAEANATTGEPEAVA